MEGLFACNAGGKLVVRKVAGLVLAAGVLVSVAGCSFNPSPETLQSYAPSDGVGVDLSFPKAQRNEGVKFRNFLVLTDGTSHALFGSVINDGNRPEHITIQLAGNNAESQSFGIEAGQTLVFDTNNQPTIHLSGKAGELIDMSVGTANGSNWEKLSVPVLDGTIDYYQNLLSPSPSATN
jgi:hypothetical protein